MLFQFSAVYAEPEKKEQVAVEAAELAMNYAKALYEAYAAQFEYYSNLLKEFVAAITGA